MEIFVKLLILFVIGSLAGWIIEVFWRRFFSPPRVWKNPGFLNGPCLPLYGFGTIFLFGICSLKIPFFAMVILFCVVMTGIEYIAGLIFIKGMKIKLWDYSKCWGNIQGIICPLFSVLWTVLGVAFYFLIFPVLDEMVNYIFNNRYMYILIGMFYGVLLCDLGITLNITAKLKKLKDEKKAVVAFEDLKVRLKEKMKVAGEKARFFLPFDSDTSLKSAIKEEVESYLEKKRIEEEDKARRKELKKRQKGK